MSVSHEIYMHRCLELARLGAGRVAPNPMVGAVLVHEGRIIGEGYHTAYGGPHAEVNCFDSVAPEDRGLIPDSVLYVSLEPCAHYGKTPPCTERILREGLRTVFVGCRDPFAEVNGRGIGQLMTAGVEVREGILERKCRDLNRRFFVFHSQQRPYIVLKWAQTADGYIGYEGSGRLMITGEQTNRLVHKWRSEEAAMLVGRNTAYKDNPRLTNRLWPGPQPLRAVLDPELSLPGNLHLFDGTVRTIVFNFKKEEETPAVIYHRLRPGAELLQQLCAALYGRRILSLIVEGGARLIQSFIDAGLWDEARVLTNRELVIHEGVQAPRLRDFRKMDAWELGADSVTIFQHEV